jgi:DNA-binding NarL/FixJ family response regulator
MSDDAVEPIYVMGVEDRIEWIAALPDLVNTPEGDMIYIDPTATNSPAALELAKKEKPDIALVDLDLGEHDEGGIVLTRKLIDAVPGISVIILTVEEGDSAPVEAIAAGAFGYVIKDDVSRGIEDVRRAIREVAAGNDYFRQREIRKVAEHLRRIEERVDPAGEFKLTRREVEVLVLVAEGNTNAEIASRLVVSLHTAKNHVGAILRKLEVPSRGKAAARARETGLITDIKRDDVPED